MKIICAHCGRSAEKSAAQANRAARAGLRIFCGRVCSGLGRRKHKAKSQKIEEKRLYDIEYRRKNLARIKAGKVEYFQRTYDPVKAAVKRKERMPLHVEYCRQPAYRKWKRQYDSQYRANRIFGPFAESFLLLQDIDREVNSRLTDYEVRQINGTLNKAQMRRREHERIIRG